ncbi:hypothetical protein [uncultured Ilyobacter sp.]|uniref:hypothetical protein n=1 Tax=uncultured Ilyobacter sp. TaxID=544433 RepID=UPI002AA72200|nr:hypothetical protein [uncultured Ilyobacter sp.]
MKKVILGLMLIVGSLSFANNRLDRGEQKFFEWQNSNLAKQERALDENLSRKVKETVSEDLLIENERGSARR